MRYWHTRNQRRSGPRPFRDAAPVTHLGSRELPVFTTRRRPKPRFSSTLILERPGIYLQAYASKKVELSSRYRWMGTIRVCAWTLSLPTPLGVARRDSARLRPHLCWPGSPGKCGGFRPSLAVRFFRNPSQQTAVASAKPTVPRQRNAAIIAE